MSVTDLTLAPGQFEGLVRATMQVRLGEHRLNKEEAEDCVSEAWITLAEKAHELEEGPIGGWLRGAARFRALRMLTKRQKETSLDLISDGDSEREGLGDRSEVLIDKTATVGESLELVELEANPYSDLVLRAARAGVRACITPRGRNHHSAKYTDEQVAQVIQLRKEKYKYSDIEALTGVNQFSAPHIVRREVRVMETTGGWTKAMAVDALKRWHAHHARVPNHREIGGDHTLPSYGTVRNLFGTWTAYVKAAGLKPLYEKRDTYSFGDVVRRLCAWYHREGSIPNREEWLHSKPDELPSLSVLYRKLGTQTPHLALAKALDECARLGCTHTALN
ncbi:MAG: sigma factor, partial [Solirubrobacteraceae bacterium]